MKFSLEQLFVFIACLCASLTSAIIFVTHARYFWRYEVSEEAAAAAFHAGLSGVMGGLTFIAAVILAIVLLKSKRRK